LSGFSVLLKATPFEIMLREICEKEEHTMITILVLAAAVATWIGGAGLGV